MSKRIQFPTIILKTTVLVLLSFVFFSCNQENQETNELSVETEKSEKPEYFLLRPELEKMYGYTQAVRVGNMVKIGGVISIDDQGNAMAKGDYLQQMKNCYINLDNEDPDKRSDSGTTSQLLILQPI
tara:strand:+ start:151 stop:531 length:381 start_codon:yes stop_codon:yes gene_type:complete